MRVNLQTAFVLHTRNFTDSRILVELFTADHGRIGAVGRGSRKTGRFAVLHPFQLLLVSWQGDHELKSLIHAETNGPPVAISGERLYCGIYLNELLLRVLAPADPHPELFENYQRALQLMASSSPVELVLRNFELNLLAELGYGIPFDVDTDSGQPIAPGFDYRFEPGSGFTLLSGESVSESRMPRGARGIFRGETVIALGARNFSDPHVLTAAKHLCRLALQPLLGNKPLKSRELFGSAS